MGRASRLLGRRTGLVGIALTTYDIWRRLPPEYRKRLRSAARKHGPRLAASAANMYSEYKRARRR